MSYRGKDFGLVDLHAIDLSGLGNLPNIYIFCLVPGFKAVQYNALPFFCVLDSVVLPDDTSHWD